MGRVHRAAAMIDQGSVGGDLVPARAQPFDEVGLRVSSAGCRSGARVLGRSRGRCRGPGTSGLPWSMPGQPRMRTGQAETPFLPGSDRRRGVLKALLRSGDAWMAVGPATAWRAL